MRKIVSILMGFLLITSSLAFAEEQINASVNSSRDNPTLEDSENQQINKDEGYGDNDQEYYEAEGVNSENSQDPQVQ